MVSVPSCPLAVKSDHKPLAAVSVQAYFVGGASRADIIHGAAVLSITDAATGREMAYWCEALLSGAKIVGWRLRKFATSEVYDVTRALDSCTCADATYQPDRPGGCRHQVALRIALPTVVPDAQTAE